MNINFTTKALAVLLTVGYASIASAQGFATWLGDRVGLGNVGRALDDANREAKRAVPVYGQTEEAVTRAGRHILTESVVESTAPLIKNLILASRNDALNAGAGPLPPEIIWEFNGFFRQDVLSAYWRVGRGNELSLQANSFRFGDRTAIALDTVLVFRSWQDANSLWLWAHELAHIEQYRAWGVDDFTKRYVRNFEAIEAAANRRADEFMAWRARRVAQAAPPIQNIPQPPSMPPQQSQGSVVSAGANPLLFAGEDAVFGEGQSRSDACRDEATMAP